MSQKNRGLYGLLARAGIYSRIQNLLGGEDAKRLFAAQYIKPERENRIVDIGCGPASILPYLGEVSYVGIDPQDSYIQAARTRYGRYGTFIHGRIDEVADRLEEGADIVLAIGVLHHLDDEQARALIRVARRVLKPKGRLVTFDAALTRPQHPIARILARLDRGRNVRLPEDYLALARTSFDRVDADLRTDLLRIPYTHFIMTCTD
jgi:SAM-dependent methyltransferase